MELRTRILTALLALFLVFQLTYFWKSHVEDADNSAAPATQHAQSNGERRAYATFLSTRLENEDEDDPYFTAVRVLAYQLLHNPDTRSRQPIPFVVIVPPHVSPTKVQTLADEGCTVVEVPYLQPLTNWMTPGEERWTDQFTKLRLWGLTQYDRILFIDGDMLLTRPLDGIWDEDITVQSATTKANQAELFKSDEPIPPSDYLIVGVSDTGGAGHEFPPPQGDSLNGGFFMMRPSVQWLEYYTSIMNIPNRFNSHEMEQSLLNYVIGKTGLCHGHAFPRGNGIAIGRTGRTYRVARRVYTTSFGSRTIWDGWIGGSLRCGGG